MPTATIAIPSDALTPTIPLLPPAAAPVAIGMLLLLKVAVEGVEEFPKEKLVVAVPSGIDEDSVPVTAAELVSVTTTIVLSEEAAAELELEVGITVGVVAGAGREVEDMPP